MVSWSGVSRYSKSSGTGRSSELTRATSTPVCSSMRSCDGADVAQGGGHQEEARARQGDERDLPGHAALGVGVVVELVHHHVGGVEAVPLAQGQLASTSAVQQMTRASGLMEASPVSMPTFSGPKSSQREKNFSEARALIGLV